VTVEVRIPGSFTLLLMKLHAFKDRVDDQRKQLAQHHALDLYRIVAMLTKEEFDQVGRLIAEFEKEPVLQVARDAAVEHFTDADGLGALRLQAYVRDRLASRFVPDVDAFIAMKELFGPWGSSQDLKPPWRKHAPARGSGALGRYWPWSMGTPYTDPKHSKTGGALVQSRNAAWRSSRARSNGQLHLKSRVIRGIAQRAAA